MILKETESAWLAGLFDGEGCVTIAKSGGLRIQFEMTHKPTLDKVAFILGIGVVKDVTRYDRKSNWRSTYLYVLGGDNAYQFLCAIRLYSVTKFAQICDALQYYEHLIKPRNGSTKKLTDKERAIREYHYNNQRRLKVI